MFTEQDAEGNWLATIPAKTSKKTELDTIQFNKANVALVPHRKLATLSSRLRSHRLTAGQLLDQNQLIVFYLNGQPVTGVPLRSRFSTTETTAQLGRTC